MTEADSPTPDPPPRRELPSKEERSPGLVTSSMRLMEVMDQRTAKEREASDRKSDRAWESMENQVKDLRQAAKDEHDAKLRERRGWQALVVLLVFVIVGFVSHEVWSAMVPTLPTP